MTADNPEPRGMARIHREVKYREGTTHARSRKAAVQYIRMRKTSEPKDFFKDLSRREPLQ